jgi:hypothetical protein
MYASVELESVIALSNNYVQMNKCVFFNFVTKVLNQICFAQRLFFLHLRCSTKIFNFLIFDVKVTSRRATLLVDP